MDMNKRPDDMTRITTPERNRSIIPRTAKEKSPGNGARKG